MNDQSVDKTDAGSTRLPRRRPSLDEDSIDEDSLPVHPVIAVMLVGSLLVYLGGGCVLIADAVISFLSPGAHKFVWSTVGVALLVWFVLGYGISKAEELKILTKTDDRIEPRPPIDDE